MLFGDRICPACKQRVPEEEVDDAPNEETPGEIGGSLVWIDLSDYSQPRVSPLLVLVKRLALSAAYMIVAFSILLGIIALHFQFGSVPDSYATGLFLIGGLIIIASFLYVQRSLDEWVSDDPSSGSMFTKDELERMIPDLQVTLGEVLSSVRAFESKLGDGCQIDSGDQHRSRIRYYRMMAGLSLIAGLFLYGILIPKLNLSGGAELVVNAVVIAGSLALMGTSIRRSRALSQPTVGVALTRDTRLPLLLLRSFQDDSLMVWRRFKFRFLSIDWYIRFEQAIVNRLRKFGPLIAVGAPGEQVPQIGAARALLADDEWQEKVRDWIDDSVIVVMIAGTTEWIRWELDQVLDKEVVHKLMFVLPPPVGSAETAKKGQQERWQNVIRPFAKTKWRAALEQIDPQTALLAMVDPDGGVTAVRSNAQMMRDYHLAILAGIYHRFANRLEEPPSANTQELLESLRAASKDQLDLEE